MNCLPQWTRRFLIACLAATASSVALAETNWNRFRGENGLGVIEHSSVPLPWAADDVAWTAKLPGKGHGSPIIQGENVYLLSADADTAERYVLSFDLKSGRERWRKSYPSVTHKLHTRNSYASSTPCADDNAVYVNWGAPTSIVVKAFSHAGEELWSRDLGRSVSEHGYGGSPMLHGDHLILLNSQDAEGAPEGVTPGQTVVVALDTKTGKTVWETPRQTTRVCYGVPVTMKDATSGRDLLIMNETGDGIFALDAATGAPVWNRKTFTKRCVSSPLIVGDLIIGTEGSGGGGNVLFAVDAKRNHEVVFDVRKAAPYVPTPVAKGDLMFLWSDAGIVSCVEVPSGQLLWSQRVGGNVSSSPIIVGDKLVGIADDGTVTILAADRTYKEIGQVKLGENIRSTPAVREDCMLVRTESNLIRIGRPRDSQ